MTQACLIIRLFAGNYFGAWAVFRPRLLFPQPLPTAGGPALPVLLLAAIPRAAPPQSIPKSSGTPTPNFHQRHSQPVKPGRFWLEQPAVRRPSPDQRHHAAVGFCNDNSYFALDNVSVLPVPALALPDACGGQGLHSTGLDRFSWSAASGAIQDQPDPDHLEQSQQRHHRHR